MIVELAASGMSVLLISSEMEEVIGLAHRVVVMRRGRQVATLEEDNLREESILHSAFGSQGDPVGAA
jgi:ABC-type sugar transport system ATPase subunit